VIFTVLVPTNPAQGAPVVLRDNAGNDTDSPAGWRFIATTDDRGEALRWLELLRKECEDLARGE
jgi:hypothetical protein